MLKGYRFVGGPADGARADIGDWGGTPVIYVSRDEQERGPLGLKASGNHSPGSSLYELQEEDLYVHGDFNDEELFEEVISKQDRSLLQDIFGAFWKS